MKGGRLPPLGKSPPRAGARTPRFVLGLAVVLRRPLYILLLWCTTKIHHTRYPEHPDALTYHDQSAEGRPVAVESPRVVLLYERSKPRVLKSSLTLRILSILGGSYAVLFSKVALIRLCALAFYGKSSSGWCCVSKAGRPSEKYQDSIEASTPSPHCRRDALISLYCSISSATIASRSSRLSAREKRKNIDAVSGYAITPHEVSIPTRTSRCDKKLSGQNVWGG